jgi:hypothetical protein
MKIKVILILAAVSFSCGRFTESPIFPRPQPDKGIELKEIPKKLLGIYKGLPDSVDSAHLIITDKEIIVKIVRNPNMSIAEFDDTKTQNLKDTTYQEGDDSLIVKVTADSVFQRNVHFDTLYYSSDKYLIKKFKGYYFCNQRFHDKWVVRTLSVTENGILISKARTKKGIDELEDLALIEPDSIVNDKLSIEKRKTYLTDERFKNEWMFVRVK